jgi:succinoglycan biosynthesis transport protein ExoP
MAEGRTMPEWVQAAAVRRALRSPRDWIGGFGRVLLRRKLPFLACVALVLASTAVYLSVLTPRYEAEALVAPADLPGQQIGPSGAGEDPLRMIDTRAMARQLVDRLDLQLLPEFHPHSSFGGLGRTALTAVGRWLPAALVHWLAKQSVDTLATRPSERVITDEERAAQLREAVVEATMARIGAEVTASSAIGMKFIAEDPQIAAAGANALADLNVEQRPAPRQKAAQEEREKPDREIERLRAEIRAAEQAIAAARGRTDAQASVTREESRLDWAGELAFWRRERAEVEARLRKAQAAVESSADLGKAAPELNSARLSQLHGRTVKVQQALAALSQRNGGQDPQIVSLRAELTALQQERRAELEQILEELRDEIGIIQSRETVLEERIKATADEHTPDPVAGGLTALEKKLAADRALLRERLEQTAPQREAHRSAPSGAARIIRPAVVPSEPTYPRLALIWGVAVAGALALGLAVAFGLEALRGARA